jgi:nucleoside 2-deoxyribosyltransferase
MTARPKLYLAGPEVFLRDAVDIGRRKQDFCAEYGFEGLFPFDNQIDPGAPEARIDTLIYRANVAMIRDADAGIFNLTPFRGPSADVGTVFELGLFAGLGKPVFAYTNDGSELLDRMKRSGDAAYDAAAAQWFDRAGMRIEDFGNVDNLMIDACFAQQGVDHFVHRTAAEATALDDLEGFVACLARASRHFSTNRLK